MEINVSAAYQDNESSAMSNNDFGEENSNEENCDMVIYFEAVKDCFKREIKEETDDLTSWTKDIHQHRNHLV